MKEKQFANKTEVIRKLWNAILTPVCAETHQNIPDMRHDCRSIACLRGDEGFAVASVLKAKGPSSHTDIQKWMRNNESFQIGNRTLREWLEDFEADDAHRDGSSVDAYPRAVASKQYSTSCNTAREADWLDRGFQMMEHYKMRLAVTSRCTFRLVYGEAYPGDIICCLDGCSLPVILRAVPQPSDFSISEEKAGSTLSHTMFSDFDQPSSSMAEDYPNEGSLPQTSTTPTKRQGNLPSHIMGENPVSRENSLLIAKTPLVIEDEAYEYTYIGEVYSDDRLHSPWEDPTKFGWKESLFLPERWREFRIV